MDNKTLTRFGLILLLSLAGSVSALSADLASYKNVYAKNSEEILNALKPKFDDLQRQYVKTLEALKAKAQSQGDLDTTKAALAELERFQAAKSMPAVADEAALPEIKAMQAAYAASCSKLEMEKIARQGDLTTKYEQALDRAQKDLTRAGNLEEATAVLQERTKVQQAIKDLAEQLTALRGKTTAKEPPPAAAATVAAAAAAEKEIQRQLAESVEQTRQRQTGGSLPMAIVALYADTEDPRDTFPQESIEYRCYSGGGYSGVMRVPPRQAWSRQEYVYPGRDGKRRIQLDPGPPYEIFTREVEITQGEVTNLGRVLLKKVKADGTATISGTVRDGTGKPMPDVQVVAGKKQTVTNGDGSYKLTGFGLEIVELKASKNGFFGGEGSVSIRNMDNRELSQDLRLFRPCDVTLKYVVSGRRSDSLTGPDVEQGTLTLTVDATRVEFRGKQYSSAKFSEFVDKTYLYLTLRTGALTFAHFMAPVFYQSLSPGTPFDSITEAEGFTSQHCPPLTEGGVIVIRGFRKGSERGVSDFCVKILVEKLTTRP